MSPFLNLRLGLALLLLCSSLATTNGSAEEEDGGSVHLEGDNVCVEQKPENKTVKVSYMESHEVKEYTWCWKVPPRCPKWRTVISTRYKDKHVSRIVNHYTCCDGYRESSDGRRCEPVCEGESECRQGTCVEPGVCSCDAGFSGRDCSVVGCPDNNWGSDCSEPCSCQNGGRCHPQTGACECLPGWTGPECGERCPADRFGPGCNEVCDCRTGQRCHHVTGDCSPCQEGTYGDMCAERCQCESNGTALCYHENGNCFCKGNFFGRRCEMHCPFGYLDGVCHKVPMAAGSCSCASDMYRCDDERGCVCKDGLDCEGGTQFIDFASLSQAQDEGAASHARTVSIIATVLLLALIVTVLAVLYYRRRMRLMQKDLEHRSVRYIENSVLDTSNPRPSAQMVVTNEEPYPFELPPPPLPPPNNGGNSVAVVNNVRTASAGASGAGAGVAAGAAGAEKNVNIDRFKLGEEKQQQAAAAEEHQGACAMPEGARHCYEEIDEDENCDILPEGAEEKLKEFETDVNLYRDRKDSREEPDYSPSKEKNNAKLADFYSKGDSKSGNKPSVNLVINNTFEPSGYQVEDEGEEEHNDEEDEETDPKTLVREQMRREERRGGFDDDFAPQGS